MGCGPSKSKIKTINLPPEDTVETVSGALNGRPVTAKSKHGNNNSSVGPDETTLPNKLLSAAIPVSDLGESLDSRVLGESLNFSHHSAGMGKRMKSGIGGREGSGGGDSVDSGYDEYDEDNNHIITEHSTADAVKEVEDSFRPVDLPELLVITGRACKRILSGAQRNKNEEAAILEEMRSQGLLTIHKLKNANSLGFTVVDAELVKEKEEAGETDAAAAAGSFEPSQFMPSRTIEKMERRRNTLRKPSGDMRARLEEAEERRKAQSEAKLKAVRETTGLERHNRMRSASATRREAHYSATVEKRQKQLQDIRDKLREKHKKHDMIRLKQQLNSERDGVVESGNGSPLNASNGGANFRELRENKEDFFDD